MGLLGNMDPAELAVISGLLTAQKGSSPANLFLNYAQMLDQRKRREEQEKLMKKKLN